MSWSYLWSSPICTTSYSNSQSSMHIRLMDNWRGSIKLSHVIFLIIFSIIHHLLCKCSSPPWIDLSSSNPPRDLIKIPRGRFRLIGSKTKANNNKPQNGHVGITDSAFFFKLFGNMNRSSLFSSFCNCKGNRTIAVALVVAIRVVAIAIVIVVIAIITR